jgi:hypothetical protein
MLQDYSSLPRSKSGTAFEGSPQNPSFANAGAAKPQQRGTDIEPQNVRKTVIKDVPAMHVQDDRRSFAQQPAPAATRAESPKPANRTQFGVVTPGGGISAVASGTIPEQKPVANSRKIVGLLVTYSWKPLGDVFPVYEGRNWIGRSTEADVSLPYDPTLSSENSFIIYRQGRFMITDRESMGGTDVNEETVWPGQAVNLPNYARIRAGSTIWTFIMIEPPATE